MINHMRKQCIQDALSPPPLQLGTRMCMLGRKTNQRLFLFLILKATPPHVVRNVTQEHQILCAHAGESEHESVVVSLCLLISSVRMKVCEIRNMARYMPLAHHSTCSCSVHYVAPLCYLARVHDDVI